MELRKLKDDNEAPLSDAPAIPVMPKTRIVRTSSGSVATVDPEGYDLRSLDSIKPFKEGEPLPKADISTNRKGIRFVKKYGDPRFYFQGNELIKIYRGLGGTKKVLFWSYREKKPLHRQIRSRLKQLGIPGA